MDCMIRKISKTLTSNSREKRQLMNFEANKEERAIIKAKAKKYTKGKIATWVRYASINHIPASEK